MANKILVLEDSLGSYGKAVEGLGNLTNDDRLFFKTPKDFTLVLFTGGADVDPFFYGDTSPLRMCKSSPTRDKFEKTVFQYALTNNIPMIGICRGFQFLNVMAKGRLLHHIDGHGGTTHLFNGPNLKRPINVNSFHHQMVVPSADSYTIGQTVDQLSNLYYGKHDQPEKWKGFEVEAAIFPEINACGVQYHPEWMATTSEGFLFFHNMANNLINLPKDEFIELYTKRSGDEKHELTTVHECSKEICLKEV